jgi:hypothetical protein
MVEMFHAGTPNYHAAAEFTIILRAKILSAAFVFRPVKGVNADLPPQGLIYITVANLTASLKA